MTDVGGRSPEPASRPSDTPPPEGYPPPGGFPPPGAAPAPLAAPPAAGPTPPQDRGPVPPETGYPPGQWAGPSGFTTRPGIIWLRPLRLGDILDGAFKAFRRNQGSLLAMSLVVNVLAAVPGALILLAFAGGWFGFPATGDAEADQFLDLAGRVYLGVLPTVVIVSLLMPVFVSHAVGEAILGRPAPLGELWTKTKGRIWPAIRLNLLVGFVWLAVGAVLIGPGFAVDAAGGNGLGWLIFGIMLYGCFSAWAQVRITFAIPALVLEKLTARTALRRSFVLTRGRWWRTFGIIVLTGIIASVIAQVIQVPVGFTAGLALPVVGAGAASEVTWAALIGVLGTIVGQIFTAPFSASVTSLLYVDARMRSEGFDQVLLRAANPTWR